MYALGHGLPNSVYCIAIPYQE
uniref:Uncharacterized protein n=1 Tax=Arundo donax TaxID=35708 RepID=A0A0A9CA75_ARUDO